MGQSFASVPAGAAGVNYTINYTIPAGTANGNYALVFANNYNSYTASPSAAGSYKSVAAYSLEIW